LKNRKTMKREAIKDRLKYQKAKAKKRYQKMGATIMESDNEVICFTANFRTHEDKVRVVLDRITEDDINAMKEINVYPNQSRQILCAVKGKWDPLLIELLDDTRVKVLYDPNDHGLKRKTMSIPKFLEVF